MNKRILKNTEWSILICVLILTTIGLIALYSATIDDNLLEFKKQCIWIVISIPIMMAILFIDYSIIARISPYLYGVNHLCSITRVYATSALVKFIIGIPWKFVVFTTFSSKLRDLHSSSPSS